MTSPDLFKNAISIALLVIQIILVLITVWIIPVRLKLCKSGAFKFLFFVLFAWTAYTMLAILFDGYLRNDVPGIGYLVVGFISGVLGGFVYMVRCIRQVMTNDA